MPNWIKNTSEIINIIIKRIVFLGKTSKWQSPLWFSFRLKLMWNGNDVSICRIQFEAIIAKEKLKLCAFSWFSCFARRLLFLFISIQKPNFSHCVSHVSMLQLLGEYYGKLSQSVNCTLNGNRIAWGAPDEHTTKHLNKEK